VDGHLARQGLTPRIAFRVPLLTAAATLAQSEIIAVRSRQVTAMMWHRRVDSIPALQWLRGLISRVHGRRSVKDRRPPVSSENRADGHQLQPPPPSRKL
jgi:hypothetical protein